MKLGEKFKKVAEFCGEHKKAVKVAFYAAVVVGLYGNLYMRAASMAETAKIEREKEKITVDESNIATKTWQEFVTDFNKSEFIKVDYRDTQVWGYHLNAVTQKLELTTTNAPNEEAIERILRGAAPVYNLKKHVKVKTLDWSDFVDEAKKGSFTTVDIKSGEEIIGREKKQGRQPDVMSVSQAPVEIAYAELKDKSKISFEAPKARPSEGGGSGLFGTLIMILAMVGITMYMMRRMRAGGMGAAKGMFDKFKKGISRTPNDGTRFADVAGMEEEKKELEEIVDFLKGPHKYKRMGAKIPKGCLMKGPPGNGKTMLARAIANEAGVPFFAISGSDFTEMFVGVGAGRVRELFEEAKKNAPCIVFIDEIDAVGRKRGSGGPGGNDERDNTLNQLLVELDGFASGEGVILLGATNNPDILDPALLRPGRFDRSVTVNNPDVDARHKVLIVHARGKPLGKDVDLLEWARITTGFSNADLANLLNEAAIHATRLNQQEINHANILHSYEKRLMGLGKTVTQNENTKNLLAYHEAGHALLVLHEGKEAEPIFKVTIVPRGGAGGYVAQVPKSSDAPYTKAQLEARLRTLVAGRVAEELIFGERNITTGASSDSDQATNLAWQMAARLSMTGDKNLMQYFSNDGQFLGSEEKKNEITQKAERLIADAYEYVTCILRKNEDVLHALAHELKEKETLTATQVGEIVEPFIERIPDPATLRDDFNAGIQAKAVSIADLKVKRGALNPANDTVIMRVSQSV